MNDHITNLIQNEVNHYKAIGAELNQMALWIASDYLRKFGWLEKQVAVDWLKHNAPELLEAIKINFPQHLPAS